MSLLQLMNAYLCNIDITKLSPLDAWGVARAFNDYANKASIGRLMDHALLEFATTVLTDLQEGRLASHPTATMHLLLYFSAKRIYEVAVPFWQWASAQGETHINAATFGAAINMYCSAGTPLKSLEDLFEKAQHLKPRGTNIHLSRSVARFDPGVPQSYQWTHNIDRSLTKSIIEARLRHLDWRAAYLYFGSVCQFQENWVPKDAVDLFIELRPLSEGYRMANLCIALDDYRAHSFTTLFAIINSAQFNSPSVRKHEVLLDGLMRAFHDWVVVGRKGIHAVGLTSILGIVLRLLPSSEPFPTGRDSPPQSSRPSSEIILRFDRVRRLAKELGLARSGSLPIEMIHAAGDLNSLYLLRTALKDMRDARYRPLEVDYTYILEACGRVHDFDSLQAIWSENVNAAKNYSLPSLSSRNWKAMFKAARRMQEHEYAHEQLVSGCRRLLHSDPAFADQLVQFYENSALPDYGEQEHQERKAHDQRFALTWKIRFDGAMDKVEDIVKMSKLGAVVCERPPQMPDWLRPKRVPGNWSSRLYAEIYRYDHANVKSLSYTGTAQTENEQPLGLSDSRFDTWNFFNELLLLADFNASRSDSSMQVQGLPQQKWTEKRRAIGPDRQSAWRDELANIAKELDIYIEAVDKGTLEFKSEIEWRRKILQLRGLDESLAEY